VYLASDILLELLRHGVLVLDVRHGCPKLHRERHTERGREGVEGESGAIEQNEGPAKGLWLQALSLLSASAAGREEGTCLACFLAPVPCLPSCTSGMNSSLPRSDGVPHMLDPSIC
jgi:hypothetical protein